MPSLTYAIHISGKQYVHVLYLCLGNPLPAASLIWWCFCVLLMPTTYVWAVPYIPTWLSQLHTGEPSSCTTCTPPPAQRFTHQETGCLHACMYDHNYRRSSFESCLQLYALRCATRHTLCLESTKHSTCCCHPSPITLSAPLPCPPDLSHALCPLVNIHVPCSVVPAAGGEPDPTLQLPRDQWALPPGRVGASRQLAQPSGRWRTKSIAHPLYNPATFDYDVAVVVLEDRAAPQLPTVL